MRRKQRCLYAVVSGHMRVVCAVSVCLGGQQSNNATVPIDADDIGGVVSGATGPEAGVWVIAETTDLSTKFAKINGHRRARALCAARSS